MQIAPRGTVSRHQCDTALGIFLCQGSNLYSNIGQVPRALVGIDGVLLVVVPLAPGNKAADSASFDAPVNIVGLFTETRTLVRKSPSPRLMSFTPLVLRPMMRKLLMGSGC